MIDNLTILFCTAMCVFIVFRALRLDRLEVWPPRRPATRAGEGASPPADPPP